MSDITHIHHSKIIKGQHIKHASPQGKTNSNIIEFNSAFVDPK
jgi:hypothetical protein